ncbi:DUF3833 family protein [Georhizobium profundi]|uniref:DUF3833 family protein n=1 Tax=Georhizobium profundi TaxID=2341112 RepID=A0A3Q8XLS4_9HYPH|nr:DUF3833 family protein [Georhizobium profundi]AZN70458.1 DUF3833 family protein [Georhizobium profundi]
MKAVRFVLIAALGLVLALPARAELLLEEWFLGKTRAEGSFSAIDGTHRRFTVDLTGTWDGTTLRLREDFAYDDGERDTKTWIFEKTSERTYSGTREDVIGTTTVYLAGNEADFTYRVDLAPGEDPNIVRFFDKLVLNRDGTITNTALVTKFGVPVARVEVNFERD